MNCYLLSHQCPLVVHLTGEPGNWPEWWTTVVLPHNEFPIRELAVEVGEVDMDIARKVPLSWGRISSPVRIHAAGDIEGIRVDAAAIKQLVDRGIVVEV